MSGFRCLGSSSGNDISTSGEAVVLANAAGRRVVELADFYHGYKQLEARDDELIVAIRVPRTERSVHMFHKVGPRRAQAIAKVGAAVTRTDAGWRVVASSVAPTVCRCPAIEDRLAAGPGRLTVMLIGLVTPLSDGRFRCQSPFIK